MTLYENIKSRIIECVKSGESYERDILKTVIGEVQNICAKQDKISDEDVIKVIKKTKQGVVDTLKILEDDGQDSRGLEKELPIYDKYLPSYLSVEQISDCIDGYPVAEEVINAGSDGQATGRAMAFFKQNPDFGQVQGQDVSQAVKVYRESMKKDG